ncbi:helix-turn-helix domain-containing protein [Enterococcus sp. DIV0086]|uniref:helix-turn-helix domain-containing protein n=1 Tax=Enterococcus sp. DIV0086 TaxID=2774655 RepID=UPI003D2CA254
MKPNKKKVGERINEIRTNLGYSMEEFGKLIGNSPRSSVNNWEKGVSIPKRDKLEKIALLGKMMPDQILYGRADEYLYDLIEQNFGVKFSDSILLEIFETIPPEKRNYDDMMWLAVAKYFIDNGTYGKRVGHLVYTSMLGLPNLYAGRYKNEFIEQSETFNQLEIMYYAYTEVEENRLHIIPFSLNEKNSELFFEFPMYIEKEGEHQVFTENFNEIGLTLGGSSIIYYGIDKKKEMKDIRAFQYNNKEDNYVLKEMDDSAYLKMFINELNKEIKQIKK